jgi:hypothetical protein
LRVDRVASGARVLARDAAGLAPLLEEARLIDDQHAARAVPEMREYILAQIVAHPLGIPAGGTQQAVHTLGVGIADRLGELPAVLTFDPTEQANQATPEPLPHFDVSEAAGNVLIQIDENVGPLLDTNHLIDLARRHLPSFAW